jgi:hypothetical protein
VKHIADDFGDDPDDAAASPSAGIEASGAVMLWSPAEPGNGTSWYFLPVTGEAAVSIRLLSAGRTGGFGSVKVSATIGTTIWQTSLFASKDIGGYLLPLKAAVRKAEKLVEGHAYVARLDLL